MTRGIDAREVEFLAALIAADRDEGGTMLVGEVMRGWIAGWSANGNPPRTRDGWAGWLAARIYADHTR